MKNLNLKIDEELLKKFKKHCIDKNCTMTSKIIDFIEEELKSNQSSNVSSNVSNNHPITDKNNKN